MTSSDDTPPQRRKGMEAFLDVHAPEDWKTVRRFMLDPDNAGPAREGVEALDRIRRALSEMKQEIEQWKAATAKAATQWGIADGKRIAAEMTSEPAVPEAVRRLPDEWRAMLGQPLPYGPGRALADCANQLETAANQNEEQGDKRGGDPDLSFMLPKETRESIHDKVGRLPGESKIGMSKQEALNCVDALFNLAFAWADKTLAPEMDKDTVTGWYRLLRRYVSQHGEGRVPEGWKLVPVEPTEEMFQATTEHRKWWHGEIGGRIAPTYEFVGEVYRLMLAAAPEPDGEESP